MPSRPLGLPARSIGIVLGIIERKERCASLRLRGSIRSSLDCYVRIIINLWIAPVISCRTDLTPCCWSARMKGSRSRFWVSTNWRSCSMLLPILPSIFDSSLLISPSSSGVEESLPTSALALWRRAGVSTSTILSSLALGRRAASPRSRPRETVIVLGRGSLLWAWFSRKARSLTSSGVSWRSSKMDGSAEFARISIALRRVSGISSKALRSARAHAVSLLSKLRQLSIWSRRPERSVRIARSLDSLCFSIENVLRIFCQSAPNWDFPQSFPT